MVKIIDSTKVQVYLLEGSPHTLSNMSAFSQKYSERYLRSMGVIVRTSILVKDYDGDKVTLIDGEVTPTCI